MGTLIVLIGLTYVIMAVVIWAGMKTDWAAPADDFRVSIIIPAKNEKRDLPRSLASIEKLDYPPDKLQVILVNHGSTDGTLKLMEDFKNSSRFNVTIVNLKGSGDRDSRKSEALIAGVEAAEGEVFAFIDAECEFAPEWLKSMTGRLKSGYDMLGGAVVIEGQSIFARLQRMDWLFLCSAGYGFAGLGTPQSLFGKNMVITKELYQRVGGFTKTPVWTEDLELVNRAASSGRIAFTMAPECAVKSLPAENLSDFFRQRLRWLNGVRYVRAAGLFALAAAILTDIFILYGFFFNAVTFIFLFVLRILGDSLILKRAVKSYGPKSCWYYLPLYVLFSVFYHIGLAVITPFVKKLRWR